MVKTERQLQSVREAARIWRIVRDRLTEATVPGANLLELDALAAKVMADHGAIPTFRGYNGFPGNVCISVNDEMIHGVPKSYVVQAGDMVTFDVGVTADNGVCDAAFTLLMPEADRQAHAISDITRRSLLAGVAAVRDGAHVGDIGHAVQKVVEAAGCSVMREFTGHGCGVKLHEPPAVPNYGRPGTGPRLAAGEVICIEPMVFAGRPHWLVDERDGWTVRSADGSLTCHWEDMVLVTEEGCEVLTR